MNQETLSAVLIHELKDLAKPGGLQLWQTLQAHPKVEKIGVSVYTAADIDWILSEIQPDIVQLPINALDQRLLESGHLEKLKQHGIEVHARSVFLQGLLLMPLAAVKTQHPKALPNVTAFLELCQKYHHSPLIAALAFVYQQPCIDKVVVGVQSQHELLELSQAAETIENTPLTLAQHELAPYDKLRCRDAQVIDPRCWHQ